MSDLDTKLFEAVKGNNIQELKKLIAKGAAVNAKDTKGWTPLHSAILGNNKEVVDVLLAADNIDVNAEDNDGSTPLHLAVECGNKEIVNTLLANVNIKVNVVDGYGKTPLDLAVESGNKDITDTLKAKGAVAEEYKSENMPLYSTTDKEEQSDELTLLESDIQPLSDFEQITQSDHLL